MTDELKRYGVEGGSGTGGQHLPFARAVQAPEIQQVWQNIGADPIVMTPEAFEKATAAEIAKLGPVVKASGAKVD